MPASVMIELAVLAVFVLCVVLGAKRGLFRSFAELAVVLLAVLVAAKAADFGADLVVDKFLIPSTVTAIQERVDEMLTEVITSTTPLAEMEQVVEAIPNQWIRTNVESLLAGIGLSTQTQLTHSARETLLEVANSLVDTVMDTMVRNILYTVLFALCFALVSFLLRLLVRLLDLPFHLPVLREINAFGGLLFGAAKGVILVWLAMWFMLRAELLLTAEMLEETVALKYVAMLFSAAGYPLI